MNKLIRNIPEDVASALEDQGQALGLNLEAYIRMKLIELARQDQPKKKTFTYHQIAIGDLSAVDLVEEAVQADAEAYTIIIDNHVERGQALYLPSIGRLGIAWGADATWTSVDGVKSGIEMWLNDPDAWEYRN
jgi:hypothetical protein